jgi:hypothetical protein
MFSQKVRRQDLTPRFVRLEKKGRRAGCREMVQGEGGNGLMDEKIRDEGVARGMTYRR